MFLLKFRLAMTREKMYSPKSRPDLPFSMPVPKVNLDNCKRFLLDGFPYHTPLRE